MRRFTSWAAIGVLAMVWLAVVSIAAADAPFMERIAKENKLIVGLNASYPPFAVWTKAGPKGFDVELARHLASTLGLDPATQVTFVPVKPDEAADALTTGKIDLAIAGLLPTPQRLRKVAFSIPYVQISRAALLQRAKIPRVIVNEVLRPMPVSSYNDLLALEPLRIGVKGGTATFRSVKAQFSGSTVVAYPDTDALAKAFLQGHVDALVHEDPFVRYFKSHYKSQARRYVALTRPVSQEGLCIAYRYGDPDFARFLDGYIRYLIDSKTIDQWKARYFDSSAWLEGDK